MRGLNFNKSIVYTLVMGFFVLNLFNSCSNNKSELYIEKLEYINDSLQNELDLLSEKLATERFEILVTSDKSNLCKIGDSVKFFINLTYEREGLISIVYADFFKSIEEIYSASENSLKLAYSIIPNVEKFGETSSNTVNFPTKFVNGEKNFFGGYMVINRNGKDKNFPFAYQITKGEFGD